MPNGHGILYNLEGTAESPLKVATIQRNIQCKSNHTELLNVFNWCKFPQKFNVQTKCMQLQPTPNLLYKLMGNTTINVPPNSERNYIWNILVMKPGKLDFKVRL